MRKATIPALLLSLCLLLCACAGQNDSKGNDPPVSDDQQSAADSGTTTELPDTPGIPDDSGDTGSTSDPSSLPAELTVELVVEWENTDALLSLLDDLSDQLHTAVEEAGCPLDRVTLTISTAGGFTAQALSQGGIDAAILPAVDIIPYENKASIIALSDEAIPETAIAVSLANADLSEEFRLILFKALTETQSGQDLLSACCGNAVFSVPTETALQSVRDYREELEKATGGHIA